MNQHHLLCQIYSNWSFIDLVLCIVLAKSLTTKFLLVFHLFLLLVSSFMYGLWVHVCVYLRRCTWTIICYSHDLKKFRTQFFIRSTFMEDTRLSLPTHNHLHDVLPVGILHGRPLRLVLGGKHWQPRRGDRHPQGRRRQLHCQQLLDSGCSCRWSLWR